jgi:hypothetical protein
MSETSYKEDVLAWSRAQAAALRRRDAGHNQLDYENLAEEIESVGLSELRSCSSQVANILEHMLKIEFVRSPESIRGWRTEIRAFRKGLRKWITRTIENELRAELEEEIEDVILLMEGRGLITPEQAAEARERGRIWEQIVDLDWYPEPRYE